MRHAICVILTCIFCFSFFSPLTTPLMCSFVNVKPLVSSNKQTIKQKINQTILWSEKAAFKKPFRVSSTSRTLDSMPGTPSTYTSYHDPASPNPVSCIIKSRSNSLGGMARMDMGLHGVGENSNDSDDLGGSGGAVGKSVPKL